MSKLKYKYEKYESPEERLRNLLQPHFYLTAAIEVGEASEEIKDLAKMCAENNESIADILDDMAKLYKTVDLTNWEETNTDGSNSE